jgi:PAS domain S-box-containing protein
MNPELMPTEERILLLAPTRRDAATAESMLNRAGISVTVCRDIPAICDEIAKGAAAVLMAEEALGSADSYILDDCLAEQSPWSDYPIIILTRGGFDSTVAARALETLGNVTLVERPVRVPTLVSAVRTAIRSRQRQYLIREYLAERELTEKALREKEERLRLIMENVHDHAIYTLDVNGNISSWNIGAERVFGYTHDEILGKPGHTVFSEDGKCDGRAVKEIRICGERGRATSEGWLIRKDGTRFWADGSMEAIHAKNGDLKGFVRIVSDRTQRKRTEEKLRDNDRRKDEFLAMLAHELRNPLSAISNAAQIVKRPDASAHHPWASNVIETHVVHLARMIDDLLDVSRITRGKIKLKKEEVDLARVIGSAVETSRPFMEERNHQLRVVIDPGPIPVTGDPTRLEQIFVNLLNNAAKYTEPGGRIQVSARTEGRQTTFSVEDNGIGMSPELVTNAFELFVQGDRAIARSEGGLGIGLTLVRSLVAMHDGWVVAESRGIGHGSRFVVNLPLAETDEDTLEPPGQPGAAAMETAAARILVVDDNVDAAEGLAQLLRLSGHHLKLSHDGPSALVEARRMKPDVILLDIGLPGMDGFDVANRLRNEGFQDALIIAVSGYGEAQAPAEQAGNSGFDHYLVKPVDFTALRNLVAAKVRRQEKTAQSSPRAETSALTARSVG